MFQEKATHYKKSKRSKNFVFFLTVDVCICICILLAAWAVFLKEPQAVALTPDPSPEQLDSDQTTIEDSGDGDDAGQTDGDGGVELNYSKDVSISISDEKATLYFGNGSNSAVDIVLQIVIQDRVFAQSNKLAPGDQVEKLKLVEGMAKLLNKGNYEGAMVLTFYDPNTNEAAAMSTTIPVTIVVKD